MLFLVLFVFVVDPQSGAVDNDHAGRFDCLGQKMAGNSAVRLEIQLKSGIEMAAPMIRAMEVMKPSVWRKASLNT